MRYASSMAYGGNLIDAAECDYEDYNYLKLLCPECRDAVFLRASSSRVVNGREIKIGAHFCHFPGKDAALISQCENRVASYTPKELQRIAAKAKNQRLKFLQRHFWECIINNLRIEYDPRIPDIFLQWEKNKRICLKLADMFADKQVQYEVILPNFKGFLEEDLLKIRSKDDFIAWGIHPDLDVGFNDDLWENFKDSICDGIDLNLHKKICYEVIAFLSTRNNRNLLVSLYAFAVNHIGLAIKEGMVPPVFGELNNLMFDATTMLISGYIITTPWRTEFAKLQKTSDRIAS